MIPPTKIDPDSVDVVFFDADGTLFQVRGSVGEIYSAAARRYGVILAAEELEREFREAFRIQSKSLLRPRESSSLESERTWWLEIVKAVFSQRMSVEVFGNYFDEVFEFFRSAEAWELFSDTEAGLRNLHSRKFRLGIISNFDSRLYDLLANLRIEHFFEHVTLSWNVGAAKPEPAIFRRALETMGAPSTRAIHVGDSLRDDVEGARQAGLRAVLLDRRGLHPTWDNGLRIRSIADLCEILSRSD